MSPAPKPTALAKKVAPRPTVAPAAADVAVPPLPALPDLRPAAECGRVADDGTAVLATSTGERTVGQWAAGSPEEGLAHYTGRFDDLVADAALIAARIQSHPQDASSLAEDARELQASLESASVIGDVEGLSRRLDVIIAHCTEVSQIAADHAAQRREDAIARKRALAEEAQRIGESETQWRRGSERLHAIIDEWRAIKDAPRKVSDELWETLSAGREAFHARRKEHHGEMDRRRAQARQKKESLVEQAVALQDSTDWAETSRAMNRLMDEWKAAGPAPRDVDDALWERFRAARQTFFDARTADSEQRDAEFQTNAEAKDALIAEHRESILSATDAQQARAALRTVQSAWEEIGFVPRTRVREFEQKIAELEAHVDKLEQDEWRKTDPELQARVQQFRDKAAQLSAEAERARAAGKTGQAEKLEAQAAQWTAWAETAESAV